MITLILMRSINSYQHRKQVGIIQFIMQTFIMQSFFINFLLIGCFIFLVKTYYASALSPKFNQMFPIFSQPSGECKCGQITVSSSSIAEEFHPAALGNFKPSDTPFNAFKSTIYKNSNGFTLMGGQKQYWRIRKASPTGHILIQNKSCKQTCPINCANDWELYQKSGYVPDAMIVFRCDDQDYDGSGEDYDGSADGKYEVP